MFTKIAASNWRLAHFESASANSERYSSFNTLVASCAQLSKCIIVLLCACLSHSFSSRQSSLRPTPSGGVLQGCIQEPQYLYEKNKRNKVKGRQSGDRWHIWGRQGRESVSNPQLIIASSMSEILLHRDEEVSWVASLLRDLEHNIPWFITQWVQRAAISPHTNTLPRTEDLL